MILNFQHEYEIKLINMFLNTGKISKYFNQAQGKCLYTPSH